ncbi:hypothetical protein TNIN_470251 [Trichonephila inaurata madagascariensis]|uniref:Uncharacterized protein n=1 Tax=Trichonephila inaurata madagascariensis TaxID=2747483 RepID=A0A8X6XPL9_9ARAC|nr:hypothetical protein TNIN_470251 [Trichonephila inaurata madagascariensis]
MCCPLREWLDFPIDHMDGILEGNTRLAVRLAKCEVAQDGVEYCGHVVGLGKQSSAQLKHVTLARRNRTPLKKIVSSRTDISC